MGWKEDIRETQKSENDLKRDLMEIVRFLPGVQRIFDKKGIDVNSFENDSEGRRFTCKFGNDTLTILVENLQYRLVYVESEGVSKQEQRFDRKTGIETLRILELENMVDWIHRDPQMIEKVRVHSKRGRVQGADTYYDISENNLDDIATLDACGDFILKNTCTGHYRECAYFTQRDPERVAKAVKASGHTKQCLNYDPSIEKMIGRT